MSFLLGARSPAARAAVDDRGGVRHARRDAAPRAVSRRASPRRRKARSGSSAAALEQDASGLAAPAPAAWRKREFVLKDMQLFFRDTTQWSQLILLGRARRRVPLQHQGAAAAPGRAGAAFFYVTLVSFLNLGLAGFVLASIAARFIFPAVSLEGRQMWLLRSSPLDLARAAVVASTGSGRCRCSCSRCCSRR